MRTLAILTNGGDTCSLNAVVKTIRDNAIAAGYPRILGFEDGYKGIIHRSVKLLTWAPIDANQGGTILRSMRFAPRDEIEKQTTFDILQDLEVGVLVVIGGDGSLSAARDLYEWSVENACPVSILGFPRTIDNDIRTHTVESGVEVALCPGYPSAALRIAKLAKDLRTTAMSSRKVFTLETMGRDAGWLAAAASLGGAECVLIPEVDLQRDDWDRFFDRVAKLYSIHGHVIIAVSEGVRIDGKQQIDAAFGPRRLGGVGVQIAQMLDDALKRRGLTIEVRSQQAGYIPRMGSPSVYDVQLAGALGAQLLAMLESGASGEAPVPTRVVHYQDIANAGSMSNVPLSSMSQLLFPANAFYDAERFCVNGSFIDYLKKFIDPREV